MPVGIRDVRFIPNSDRKGGHGALKFMFVPIADIPYHLSANSSQSRNSIWLKVRRGSLRNNTSRKPSVR